VQKQTDLACEHLAYAVQGAGKKSAKKVRLYANEKEVSVCAQLAQWHDYRDRPLIDWANRKHERKHTVAQDDGTQEHLAQRGGAEEYDRHTHAADGQADARQADDCVECALTDDRKEEALLVEVVNGCTLDVALALRRAGLAPVVLNMASPRRPGGGYRSGAAAQEENLFRRSNYQQVLEDRGRRFDTRRRWRYPLPDYGGVYSPRVMVFRGSLHDGYPFLYEPLEVAMIAVAAYGRYPLRASSSLSLS
jgi:Microbial-type PARG, catalytic domain